MSGRSFALRLVVLVALALFLRAWLLLDSSMGSLPVGPDAEDWVLMARGLAAGDSSFLEGHRYPLVPWLAASLAPAFGDSVLRALAGLSVVSGALTALVAALLARPLLGGRLAVVAGAGVAFAPALVLSGISTTAYPLFGLLLLTLFWALLCRPGWAGDALAAVSAALLVACLTQGLLHLLSLLPVALPLRRWRRAGLALAGGALGWGLVWLLHPTPHDPVGWMAAEAWRYLSGNVAEEQAMSGVTYIHSWREWAIRELLQPPWTTLGLVLLALVGMVLVGHWPAVRLEARLPGWLRGPEIRPLPQGAVAALAWALVPLAVLLVVMGSGHHSLVLWPLLGIVALLGLRRLVPAAGGLWVPAVLVVGLAAWSLMWRPSLLMVLGPPLRADRGLAVLGERVGALGEAPVVVTAVGPGEVNPVHRGVWACPLDTRVVDVGEPVDGPALLVALRAVEIEGLEPVGEPETIPLGHHRELWVTEVRGHRSEGGDHVHDR